MTQLLCLETATLNCSVALGTHSATADVREIQASHFVHAEALHELVQALLETTNQADIAAVAVSEGPGSYTGLRIGVAAAKGLAMALNVPLLAIPTLEHFAAGVAAKHPGYDCYVPMLDARRMEVYAASYQADGTEVQAVRAVILDEPHTPLFTEGQRVLVFGDGANKAQAIFGHSNIDYLTDVLPSAAAMVDLGVLRLTAGCTVDLAQFEPYYLKDFIAGTPKKVI